MSINVREVPYVWERRLDNWVEQVRSQSALPLQLNLWNGKQLQFGQGKPQVIVSLPHVSALKYFWQPSLANLGEAYVNGKIEVEGKAKAVISVANALAARTLKLEGKFARVVRSIFHNKAEDAEAVHYHYDVSNDFYRLWLDPNMVYSCAYFENGNETLAEAQMKKIDHILAKVRLRPGDTLLDIGCGWGALVMRAASKFGARCVGVTLSENQAALARQKVKEAGLERLVEIRCRTIVTSKAAFSASPASACSSTSACAICRPTLPKSSVCSPMTACGQPRHHHDRYQQR